MTVSGEGKEKGETPSGAPLLPLLVSIFLGSRPGRPLWERSLSDRSYAVASVIGMTWTYLRPSLPSRNATCPSVSAKSVWSLPRPTLSPGYHFVPRWRTMMLPARTVSLPNFFTPRRFDSESRPLREEPPAFLCAIAENSYFLALGAAFLAAGLAAALAGAASFV